MKINLKCSLCGGLVSFMDNMKTPNIKPTTFYYCTQCKATANHETIEIDHVVNFKERQNK